MLDLRRKTEDKDEERGGEEREREALMKSLPGAVDWLAFLLKPTLSHMSYTSVFIGLQSRPTAATHPCSSASSRRGGNLECHHLQLQQLSPKECLHICLRSLIEWATFGW